MPTATLEDVIDVVPVEPGVWLARCECGTTQRFGDAEAGWVWVLDHPCAADTNDVIDLTSRNERSHGHTTRD